MTTNTEILEALDIARKIMLDSFAVIDEKRDNAMKTIAKEKERQDALDMIREYAVTGNFADVEEFVTASQSIDKEFLNEIIKVATDHNNYEFVTSMISIVKNMVSEDKVLELNDVVEERAEL